MRLTFGSQRVEFAIPAIEAKRSLQVAVDYAGQPVAEHAATLKPARKWVVYLLPHSHVDIGYTHLQPEVMRRQWDNIDKALDLCARRPAIRPRRGSSGMPKCFGPWTATCARPRPKNSSG